MALVTCVLVGAPLSVMAQTMYRCGATYQDRPCANAESKVLGRSGAARSEEGGAGAAAPDVAPGCKSQGAAAQKIMWEKESGRTLEEQLSRRAADPTLLQQVYGMRGSSLEVRKAIEAECMAALQRQAQAAELMRAANNLMSAGAGRAPAQGLAAEPAERGRIPDGRAAPEATTARRADTSKAERCARLSDELRELNKSQRAGGTGEHMDQLAEKVRGVHARRRELGC
jgi:hypothetical protein